MFGKNKQKVFIASLDLHDNLSPYKVDYGRVKKTGEKYYDTREECQKHCDAEHKKKCEKLLSEFPDTFKKTYIDPSRKEYKFDEGALVKFLDENRDRNNGYELCRKIFGTEGVSGYSMEDLELSDEKFLKEYRIEDLWVKKFYETHELKGDVTFLYKT